MKILLSLAIGAVCSTAVFGQPYQAGKGFKVRYDKFNDRTSVESPLRALKASKDSPGRIQILGIQGLFSFRGDKPDGNIDQFFLRFMAGSAGSSWNFIRDHRLRVLADDKIMPIADAKGEWQGGSAADREYVTYRIDRIGLEQMVNAKKLELQIGSFETSIGEKDRDILRQMLRAATITP